MNLSCRQASRLVSESMDRRLSRWERFSLRIHLVICSYCRRVRRQLEWLRDATRTRLESPDHDPIRLSPQARARIRHALGMPT